LQEVPILVKFVAMDFDPRLDKALLRLRQATSQALNGVDGEHRRVFLIDVHRTLQTKFVASFVLPTPVYCATCG
jgi:hypothetical protein